MQHRNWPSFPWFFALLTTILTTRVQAFQIIFWRFPSPRCDQSPRSAIPENGRMMNPFRFSVKFLVGPRDSQEAGHFRFVFYGEIHIRQSIGVREHVAKRSHALDLADIFVTCIDDLDSFHVLLENPVGRLSGNGPCARGRRKCQDFERGPSHSPRTDSSVSGIRGPHLVQEYGGLRWMKL